MAEEASEKIVETVVVEKKMVQEDKDEKEYKDRMVIRSYSSMILFIPSFIMSLVLGITQIIMDARTVVPFEDRITGSGYMNIMGVIFLITFALNLILIAFDFNRARTVIIVLLIIVLAAALLLVNAYTGFLSGGVSGPSNMSIYFSSHVYFGVAALLFFILLFTFLGSLFNYYVIEGNELLHHKGLGGGVERYPATNMSVVKEFPDLVELLIFRSGTLILTPARATRSIVLRNVIGVNKKIRNMNEILSRLKVDIN